MHAADKKNGWIIVIGIDEWNLKNILVLPAAKLPNSSEYLYVVENGNIRMHETRRRSYANKSQV